jgi:hypothetical protein
MNINLKREFEFNAGIIYKEQFCVNWYSVLVHMTTVSLDPEKHNIAYERIKYWFDFVLNNAIIINESDPKLVEWLSTETRLIIMPEDPVDQLLGIMLYQKLNALTEGNLDIIQVELKSTVGDNVVYIHNENEGFGPLSENGWWNDSKPNWTHMGKKKSKNSKVIKMDRLPSWSELNLDFDTVPDDLDSHIVQIDFSKNAPK